MIRIRIRIPRPPTERDDAELELRPTIRPAAPTITPAAP